MDNFSFNSNYLKSILTTIYSQFIRGFPDSSVGIESAFNAGDPGLIPGLGRSVGKGIGYPLQYSWVSLVDQLVKNSLQCRKPGFSPLAVMIHWRRECQSIPVFLPGEFHGQRSLAAYSLCQTLLCD